MGHWPFRFFNVTYSFRGKRKFCHVWGWGWIVEGGQVRVSTTMGAMECISVQSTSLLLYAVLKITRSDSCGKWMVHHDLCRWFFMQISPINKTSIIKPLNSRSAWNSQCCSKILLHNRRIINHVFSTQKSLFVTKDVYSLDQFPCVSILLCSQRKLWTNISAHFFDKYFIPYHPFHLLT